ncbi:MAG: D-2-hydroxyacid dehydrogenase family protein [Rhodospirillaceae bacterium]|jgi:phosphoglycerate dehydrogenase-like enzyme|nr:D-2-hydroxyacid dehydrogenase family protein [Rhodospirillaceae bacterium]MBT6136683.1 D-2-hydroxyacid dehydrogenase family protein [Rhodospirillaceae bacterium]
MPKIAILDDYANVSLDMANWGSLPDGYEPVVFKDNLVEVGALAERLADFEIVCAMRERTPFPGEVFAKLPNLKLFITSGMRNASVDFAAARAQGVTCCGTSGSGWGTSEHAWGLIHACARYAPHDDRMMREGKWQTRMGVELHGKTLGLLGLGRLGGHVAKVAPAFGMNIVAWSQNLTAERCAEVGAELVDKDELFRRSDFISIHVVLSDRSRGLIGARELALMKSTASLINTSRGPIVDQAALIEALTTGQIRGAATDVYDIEPLPVDHPYRSLENLIMTPHVGYVTEEGYRTFYSQMVEDIQAWHDGAPLRVIK